MLATWREEGRRAPSERIAARAVDRDDMRGGDLRPSTWVAGPEAPDVARASERALELARELRAMVDGPLAHETTEEHRRALRRLVERLEGPTARALSPARELGVPKTTEVPRPGVIVPAQGHVGPYDAGCYEPCDTPGDPSYGAGEGPARRRSIAPAPPPDRWAPNPWRPCRPPGRLQ
ncbi:MAG: hypothetical protein ACRD0L_08105 [Acidimicrobiales bacterium]